MYTTQLIFNYLLLWYFYFFSVDAETKDDNGEELDDELEEEFDDELEEEFDNELEEEYSEDTETMPVATTTTAKKASVVKATAKASKGLSKYKANESPWHPRASHHVYPAKGYMRDTLLIEPPGSFTGEEGSYEASFDSDDQEFVFKIPPNPIFTDPHAIHAYQAAHYGRVFADDSAKEQAFKQSSKGKKDKWATFRHQLPFKGTRSEDLGRVPWMDFTSIEVDGKDTPVLIFELRSIAPIEEEETVKKQSTGLQMKTFKSPSKIKGVNMASGPTAQMALHIEQLMKNGLSFSDIKNAAKRGGLKLDDMVVDGEEKEENSNKKSKGLGGNWNAVSDFDVDTLIDSAKRWAIVAELEYYFVTKKRI